MITLSPIIRAMAFLGSVWIQQWLMLLTKRREKSCSDPMVMAFCVSRLLERSYEAFKGVYDLSVAKQGGIYIFTRSYFFVLLKHPLYLFIPVYLCVLKGDGDGYHGPMN